MNGKKLFLIVTLLSAACRGDAPPLNPERAATPAPELTLQPLNPTRKTSSPDPQSPSPAPQLSAPSPPAADSQTITVIYTNDEHGWLEGVYPEKSAAHLMATWQEKLGYQPGRTHLVLSGGDMWTGPAISTWFDGASQAEVMAAMGYGAAAIGNHEFDFGLDLLTKRALASPFPFVAANIRYKDSGADLSDIGIEPYALVNVTGITAGIIGLSTAITPYTTKPDNVRQFDFFDYEEVLRQAVPDVKEAGADLILVPAHICQEETETLAQIGAELGVHLIGSGHCNEYYAKEANGVALLGGGSHMATYAFAQFHIDPAAGIVELLDFGVGENDAQTPDPEIAGIIARWSEEAEVELNRTIGYTDAGIGRRTQTMEQLVVESWLWGYPAADVAMTNLGGIRAAIPPGEMTLSHIIGVLPFDNVLIEASLSGSQLIEATEKPRLAIGGIHFSGGKWLLDSSGQPINANQQYSVLVNDFMYAGGDGLTLFADYDPDAYDTAINWRQPLIDWILEQNSSAAKPLEDAIENLIR